LSPSVSPNVHAFTQLPGSLRRLWAPFSHEMSCFPVALSLVSRNRLVPPASSTSELRSLLRVRSRLDWVSPHQPAATLLGFFPSRAFASHASDPRPVRTRRLEHVPFLRRVRARDSEDRSPPCRVRPFLCPRAPNRPRRRIPAPFETGPHRLSTASPSPLALEPRAHSGCLTCEASKYVKSGVSPQRSPSLLGFLTLSPVS